MPRRPDPQVPLLTMAEAARVLGVHPDTVGRWVRRGELPAYKLGSVVRVRPDDLEDHLGRRRLAPGPAPSTGPGSQEWAQSRQRLLQHLLAGDVDAAWSVVERLFDHGATLGEVHVRLFTLVTRRLGTQWETGQILLGRQRRAIEMVAVLMARAVPRLLVMAAQRSGTAVVATLPGEGHALGPRMLVDFIASIGWTVHHLGTHVPAAAVADLADQTAADVVCLSTHVQPDAVQLAALSDHRVVIGGPGIDRAGPLPPHVSVIRSLQRLREMLAADGPAELSRS